MFSTGLFISSDGLFQFLNERHYNNRVHDCNAFFITPKIPGGCTTNLTSKRSVL